MGYYGNLTYSDDNRQFVGLPMEDIKEGAKIVNDRYIKNKSIHDAINQDLINTKLLDKYDPEKQRMNNIITDKLSAIVETDAYEKGSQMINDAYKTYTQDSYFNQAKDYTTGFYNKQSEYLDETKTKGWSKEEREMMINKAYNQLPELIKYDKDGNIIDRTDPEVNIKGSFKGYSPISFGEKADISKTLLDALEKVSDAKTGQYVISRYEDGVPIMQDTTTHKEFKPEDDLYRVAMDTIRNNPAVKDTIEKMSYLYSIDAGALGKSGETPTPEQLALRGKLISNMNKQFNGISFPIWNEKKRKYDKGDINAFSREIYNKDIDQLTPEEFEKFYGEIVVGGTIQSQVNMAIEAKNNVKTTISGDFKFNPNYTAMYKAGIDARSNGSFDYLAQLGEGATITQDDISVIMKGVDDLNQSLAKDQKTFNDLHKRVNNLTEDEKVQYATLQRRINENKAKVANQQAIVNSIDGMYTKGGIDINKQVEEVYNSLLVDGQIPIENGFMKDRTYIKPNSIVSAKMRNAIKKGLLTGKLYTEMLQDISDSTGGYYNPDTITHNTNSQFALYENFKRKDNNYRASNPKNFNTSITMYGGVGGKEMSSNSLMRKFNEQMDQVNTGFLVGESGMTLQQYLDDPDNSKFAAAKTRESGPITDNVTGRVGQRIEFKDKDGGTIGHLDIWASDQPKAKAAMYNINMAKAENASKITDVYGNVNQTEIESATREAFMNRTDLPALYKPDIQTGTQIITFNDHITGQNHTFKFIGVDGGGFKAIPLRKEIDKYGNLIDAEDPDDNGAYRKAYDSSSRTNEPTNYYPSVDMFLNFYSLQRKYN